MRALDEDVRARLDAIASFPESAKEPLDIRMARYTLALETQLIAYEKEKHPQLIAVSEDSRIDVSQLRPKW